MIRLDILVVAVAVEVVVLLLLLVLAVEARNKPRMASFFATCTAVLPLCCYTKEGCQKNALFLTDFPIKTRCTHNNKQHSLKHTIQTLFLMCVLAPLSSRALTISAWPSLLAHIRAVLPR